MILVKTLPGAESSLIGYSFDPNLLLAVEQRYFNFLPLRLLLVFLFCVVFNLVRSHGMFPLHYKGACFLLFYVGVIRS